MRLVHDEETAVDESGLFFDLLSEGAHVGAAHLEVAEPAGRLDGGQRHDLLMPVVKGNRGVDVAVDQPVPVCQKECLLFDEPQHPLKPSPGHGGLARIDQGHAPILFVVLTVVLELRAGAEPEGHVAGIPLVIAEEVLDHFAFVAEAQDEILVAVVGVDLHDMPKYRPFANRHHRFGPKLGFLAQARPQTTAQNHHFHQ